MRIDHLLPLHLFTYVFELCEVAVFLLLLVLSFIFSFKTHFRIFVDLYLHLIDCMVEMFCLRLGSSSLWEIT